MKITMKNAPRRTRTLQVATLAAALMLTAACGGGDSKPKAAGQSGPAVAGEVQDGAFKGHQFTYASFGATVNEVLDDIFDEFTEKSGAKFVGDSPFDPAKIGAQVKSGNLIWDMVTVDPAWAAANCGELLEPWDMSKVDTTNLPDGMSTQECGIPVNTTGWIASYNTKAWGGQTPNTWADYFDVKKFPGKRAVFAGTPAQALEGALLADGVAPEDMYPLDVDRAFKKFDTIRDHLIFYSTGAEQEQIMASNQAAMCMCWAGRVFAVNEAGAKWDIIHETPVIATTVWGLVKGSKNADVAHAAVNYFMGAKATEMVQEGIAYPGPNKNGKPNLTKNAKLVDVLKPPFEAPLESDPKFWAENVEKLTDRWVTWMNG